MSQKIITNQDKLRAKRRMAKFQNWMINRVKNVNSCNVQEMNNAYIIVYNHTLEH